MSKYLFKGNDEAEWLGSVPKKAVAVKAIIRSTNGNILLVKPSYKPKWQFPGGGVEYKEDPVSGLLREIREEVSLDLSGNNFTLIGTVFRPEHDNLTLVYESDVRLDEKGEITVEEGELLGYKFESPANVAAQLSDYWLAFCSEHLK